MTSATVPGSSVCYNCYITVTNPLDIVGVPGIVYDYTAYPQVMCSRVGRLYADLQSFSAGLGITNYQWNQLPPVGNACQYNQQCPVPSVASCGVGTVYATPRSGSCLPNYRWLYFLYNKTAAGTHCFAYGLVLLTDPPTVCK